VTDHHDQHGGLRQTRQKLIAAAEAHAAHALRDIVVQSGGTTVTELRSHRVTWPGIEVAEPDPIATLEAAHELERAAYRIAADSIRRSREAGRSWYEMGDALDLHSAAAANKLSVAEEAYGEAVSYDSASRCLTFTWKCPACSQVITDLGPFPELPDQERGHSANCARWTAHVDSWRSVTSGRRPPEHDRS
jgi:hypothetical protein